MEFSHWSNSAEDGDGQGAWGANACLECRGTRVCSAFFDDVTTDKSSRSIMYVRDGTIVSGDSMGIVKFWDPRTHTQMHSFRAHGADVLCLTISHVRFIFFVTNDISTEFMSCRMELQSTALASIKKLPSLRLFTPLHLTPPHRHAHTGYRPPAVAFTRTTFAHSPFGHPTFHWRLHIGDISTPHWLPTSRPFSSLVASTPPLRSLQPRSRVRLSESL